MLTLMKPKVKPRILGLILGRNVAGPESPSSDSPPPHTCRLGGGGAFSRTTQHGRATGLLQGIDLSQWHRSLKEGGDNIDSVQLYWYSTCQASASECPILCVAFLVLPEFLSHELFLASAFPASPSRLVTGGRYMVPDDAPFQGHVHLARSAEKFSNISNKALAGKLNHSLRWASVYGRATAM